MPAAEAAYYKINTTEDIKQSARTLAYDLMLLYQGNKTGQIPGILPGPPSSGLGDYYWWEGGAMMGTYVDYWKLTGDTSYNAVVTQGILHQVGENRDFMPANHTASLGNDDQGFWGMTAMLAAENKFPDPPEDQPQWLALAQAVWTTQANPDRHDEHCGGGLRWQIPFSNSGYNYKNTIANGCFFNIGARLARYTKNDTYAQHAEQTWDWLWGVNYIDHDTYKIWDGAHVPTNCTDINKTPFSYNAAILLQGAAYMYNYTDGSQKWKDRVDKLLDTLLTTFFEDDIAYEASCEGHVRGCTTDMVSFKGYVHRWTAVVSQIAPYTKDKILPVLKNSAQAAVNQCTGGESGRMCGFFWKNGTYVDPAVTGIVGTTGAGERMNVLAAVSSLLIDQADAPVTNNTGGTSKGDPDAGKNSHDQPIPKPISTRDKAGAAILTILVVGGGLCTFAWMSYDPGMVPPGGADEER